MPMFFPRTVGSTERAMVFVDGEGLAIRYGKMLEARGATAPDNTRFEKNVYVWSLSLNNVCLMGSVVRKHYYTAVQGDEDRVVAITETLKDAGIEAPRVFHKKKGKPSKRVDILLATEMLNHAVHRHFDVAVLVAGDEDYVPLVEAVQREGCRVFVWFVSDGLSPVLRRTADSFADLEEALFSNDHGATWS